MFIIKTQNEYQNLIFEFCAATPTPKHKRDITGFKVSLSYSGHTGLMYFNKTYYAKSLAPSQHNATHLYQ